VSSNGSKPSPKKNWGTESEYFPVPLHVAPATDEDLERSRALTPSQRVEWLLMMQKLLLKQFARKKP
jgi:hypothetical protein